MPPQRLTRWLLGVGLLLSLASTPAHATPVEVGPDTDWLSLTGHLDAAYDESGRWRLDTLPRAALSPVGEAVLSRAPGGPVVWLRAQVHNPSSVTVQRLVILRFRLIDSVQLHIEREDGSTESTRAGEDTALGERAISHDLPMMPLSLQPGETATIWARLDDRGAFDAPLAIGTWPRLAQVETHRNLLNGLFMGSLLVVGFFALVLAIIRRSRLYGWFTAYLAAELFLCLFYFWGNAGALLPAESRPDLVNRAIVVGAVNMFWTSMGFATRLMDLDREMPRLFVWLRRFSWGYLGAAIAAAVLPYQLAVALSAAAFLPVMLPVGASLAMARRNRVAAMYAASWALLMTAVLSVYLRVAAVLPAELPTEYFVYLGFFLQFSVLVAAMARRMRAIEREQRRALEAELAAYQRNAALSRSFERFVPKAFLDRLERTSITEIELGHAVSKRMTVLFSDIRSFTTLVEHMSPEENFAFINEYLGFMEPAIHQHLGFIDKYIGDAVMALFDDEQLDNGGADQAVRAAIGMHEALARYNALRVERGDAPVDIGIGLHTGALMLGTIGGRDRLNASVIGDSVNLASRIEGLTKRYGAATLLTGPTVACLPVDTYDVRRLDRVRVKGKTEAVDIYQLLDCEPPAVRAKRLQSMPAFGAARGHLMAGRLEEAREGFRAIVAADPTDTAAVVNLENCDRLLRDGIPDAWDGAMTLTAK